MSDLDHMQMTTVRRYLYARDGALDYDEVESAWLDLARSHRGLPVQSRGLDI